MGWGLVKFATYNIDNINKRLDNLLTWLAKAGPDVVSRMPETAAKLFQNTVQQRMQFHSRYGTVVGMNQGDPTVYPGSYVEYAQKLGHEAPGIYS